MQSDDQMQMHSHDDWSCSEIRGNSSSCREEEDLGLSQQQLDAVLDFENYAKSPEESYHNVGLNFKDSKHLRHTKKLKTKEEIIKAPKQKRKLQDNQIIIIAPMRFRINFQDIMYEGLNEDQIEQEITLTIQTQNKQFNITDGESFLIRISFEAIKFIEIYTQTGQISINYKSPPFYFIGNNKGSKVSWKRYVNIPSKSAGQDFPYEIFFPYFFMKEGCVLLKLEEFTQALQKINEKVDHIIEIKTKPNFQLRQIREVIIKYSRKRFENIFIDWKVSNWKSKVQLYELEFTLISFLYCCNSINIDHLFTLCEFLDDQHKNHQKSIQKIWRIMKDIETDQLEISMLKNKGSIMTFRKSVEKKLDKKLPQPLSKKQIKVQKFLATPSGIIPVGWITDSRNRLNRHYVNNDFQFMKMKISDDHTMKERPFQKLHIHCIQYLQESLIKFDFLRWKYVPLGWTQSQLKQAQAWFVLQSASDIKLIRRSQFLRFLGDFSQIDNPALKAARIGQNLAGTYYFIKIKKVKEVIKEDEKSSKGYLFTDGIGCISRDIVQKIHNKFCQNSSVFQMRFRGCKGVLALNHQLPKNTIILRKSMKKFECPSEVACQDLDILEFHPYRSGYLNRQIIMLLNCDDTHQLETRVFLQILDQYLKKLLTMTEVIEQQFFMSKHQLFQKQFEEDGYFYIENIYQVLGQIKRKKSLNLEDNVVLRSLLIEKFRQKLKELRQKSRIRIEKSARLIGIIDEYEILNENEVFFIIQKPSFSGIPIRQEIEGEIMVTRNPCRHPADIRVLECLPHQQIKNRLLDKGLPKKLFQQMPNCLIFPKKGEAPLTSQISGSDLDGDLFFITWDQRLIPEQNQEAFIVDDLSKQQRQWEGDNEYEKMINFFVEFYENSNLGRIANNHLAKADNEGLLSSDCLQLCKLFYKAVDYGKRGYSCYLESHLQALEYPHFMQRKNSKQYNSDRALGRIYDQVKSSETEFIQKFEGEQKSVPFLPQFQKYREQYSDQEIQEAIKCVYEFNTQINSLLKIYHLERESQLYLLSSKKQDLRIYRFLADLQVKYFQMFFEGLEVKHPKEYYTDLNYKIQYFLSESSDQILEEGVKKRILLWYHILNCNLFQKTSLNINQWLLNIRQCANSLEIDLFAQANYIGLLWFSLPTLAYIFTKQYIPSISP